MQNLKSEDISAIKSRTINFLEEVRKRQQLIQSYSEPMSVLTPILSYAKPS